MDGNIIKKDEINVINNNNISIEKNSNLSNLSSQVKLVIVFFSFI